MGVMYSGGRGGWRGAVCAGAALLALAGCDGLKAANPFKGKAESVSASGETGSARSVERDVEAPEVFQISDKGLWDGRPSLGGVWVAHPDVTEPERVIIRNTDNSKFVIGALFRRERANPGPAFQISSDAAAALGMLAGAPAALNVTALRREEAPAPGAAAETLEPDSVETSNLDPVSDVASAAIDAAEPTDSPLPAPTPEPVQATSTLDRPYLQIGIFSVEENAESAATAMRQAGMVPAVLKQESQGKTFWRVIVGPATSASGRDTLLSKVKGAGFDDAYAVTN